MTAKPQIKLNETSLPASDFPKPVSPMEKFLKDFLLGGVSAGISKTVASPIEVIKMRLQNMDEMLKRGTLSKPYTGIANCANRVVAEEGFFALWKGNFTNVLRYFPTQALNFAFKDGIKRQFPKNPTDSTLIKLGKNVAAGGIAGAFSLTFVYSLDYARTRLTNDNKNAKTGGQK